ncbi:DNA polymerase eta [Linum perenne]
MPVARPESSHTRIIAHVDMDCFYVQVEQRKQPELRGLPAAVVQYNEWKGGGLIAVSYEARGFGVKRCVILGFHLFQVVSILARKGRCERASIDEVYLDLTDAAESMMRENPPENLEAVHEEVLKSHVLGLQNQDGIDGKENVRRWLCNVDADHRDKLLACGAIIVAELRMQVLQETEFTCSAGIAHNKMLAKLASGMNKPAQQTVVPLPSVDGMLSSLPIKKMKQLGGKLGSSLQYELGVNTVGDLLQFSEEKLQDSYGVNTGTWLWNIARGINGEEVQERLLPKSHGSGKSFPGPRALKTIASSSDRDSHRKFPSKSCPLRYGTVKIQEDAFNLFQAGLREFLGSFGANSQGTSSIMKYFGGKQTSDSPVKHVDGNFIDETAPSSSSGSKINSELECHESRVEFNGNHVDYQEEKTITMQDDKNLTLLRHDEDSSTSEASQPVPQAPSDSWSGKNINAQEFASEDARHQSSAAHSKRKEQKKNDSKDQGTILRFLKSNDPCISSEQDRFRKTGDQNAGGGRGTWNYKIDEIDESVIVELPKEIQDEVKAWIRPQKRANTVRRGATIGHYFSASQK